MGLMYVSFGKHSGASIDKSISSLRKLGVDLPIICVGSRPTVSSQWIKWEGHEPWPEDKNENSEPDQRFRAGYVKPFLYDLSPFDYTLYVDADTEFQKNPLPGFKYLDNYDICAPYCGKERTIGLVLEIINLPFFTKLPIYRKIRVEIYDTNKLVGTHTPVMNSGVFFFRKSDDAKNFFHTWYKEWLYYKGWDEEYAWLRAEKKCPETKLLHLSMSWSNKLKNKETIIWHRMGSHEVLDPHTRPTK